MPSVLERLIAAAREAMTKSDEGGIQDLNQKAATQAEWQRTMEPGPDGTWTPRPVGEQTNAKPAMPWEYSETSHLGPSGENTDEYAQAILEHNREVSGRRNPKVENPRTLEISHPPEVGVAITRPEQPAKGQELTKYTRSQKADIAIQDYLERLRQEEAERQRVEAIRQRLTSGN
jgi:hypothetical protein